VTFRDIEIEYTGGGTAEESKAAVPQAKLDARKLPA
jgi:hypothetical protein